MLTTITPEVPSEDEHAIVALLTDKSLRQATHIQDALVRIFGDAIWLQRPSGLHITLMEIICDAEYKNLSRQEHFVRWHKEYGQAVQEVLAGFSPFDIHFNELVVSQRAIIVKAVDTKPLNDIRNSLLSKISLPEGTKSPPDITHCSLARFAKAIDLEEAVRVSREIRVDFVQHIAEFALVKDLGPPHFNGAPMQVYPLSTRPR